MKRTTLLRQAKDRLAKEQKVKKTSKHYEILQKARIYRKMLVAAISASFIISVVVAANDSSAQDWSFLQGALLFIPLLIHAYTGSHHSVAALGVLYSIGVAYSLAIDGSQIPSAINIFWIFTIVLVLKGYKYNKKLDAIINPTKKTGSKPTPKLRQRAKTAGYTILLILLLAGVYASGKYSDENANNTAIQEYNQGGSNSAEASIAQLKELSESTTDENIELNALKNIGYIAQTEGDYEESYESFKKALALVGDDKFERHLISAEIALLEGNALESKSSFDKALALKPDDFQVNNSLALFHLDLFDEHIRFIDYPKALEYGLKAYEVAEEINKSTAEQNLAIAYFFNDDYAQTIALMDKQDKEASPYVYYWLGWAYAARAEDRQAGMNFKHAQDAGIELEPEAIEYIPLAETLKVQDS